jgi:tetratricopeptide (TPR) repeat protein
MALELIGADAVLQHSEISSAANTLRQRASADPLLALHGQMLQQYIRLYQAAGVDARSALIGNYSWATDAAIESWFSSGQYGKVAAFARGSFEGLPIPTFTSGDKNVFVKQLNRCIRSMIKTKKYDEGKKLLADALLLCDKILAERAWDWYVNSSYEDLCFDVANELVQVGDKKSAQPLLLRGWHRQKQLYGAEIKLDQYPELPLKGVVPEKASRADTAFFRRFAPNAMNLGILRLTIPSDFSGVSYPFNVSVYTGRNGYAGLQDQFRWLKEVRGGTVPADVIDLFKRINATAVTTGGDFMALASRQFHASFSEQATRQKSLDAAISDLKAAEALYAKLKNDARRLELAVAYSRAADRALYRSRWSDAVSWSLKSIELNSTSNPTAYGNLATAYLFQGKYDQAVEIYQAHWQDPFEEQTIGEIALADFAALDRAAIWHPDVARIKSALAPKKVPQPGGVKDQKKVPETKN